MSEIKNQPIKLTKSVFHKHGCYNGRNTHTGRSVVIFLYSKILLSYCQKPFLIILCAELTWQRSFSGLQREHGQDHIEEEKFSL